jgi:hypothetical protein
MTATPGVGDKKVCQEMSKLNKHNFGENYYSRVNEKRTKKEG